MDDTAPKRTRRRLGVGIIGSGRIGSHRARFAAAHPAVDHLVVADRDGSAAQRLAEEVGADGWTTDIAAVVDDVDVTTVVVSTSEGEHAAPTLAALRAGKPVLVEKPIALTLEDADRLVSEAAGSGSELRIGYSRRFRRRYQLAKEQINQGRLGTLVGATARVYNSRTQALAMLERDPHATPVVDALTYYVDLMGWFFAGRRVEQVTAMGNKGVLAAAGHTADDVTWALLRLDDGAVVNLGVSYALPAKYPARGHASRVELLGTDGVLIIDDDHADQIMYTDHGIPHVYLPDDEVNAVFLSSGTPGDWAMGDFIGPLNAESRAWFDHLATGAPCHLTTPKEARATLATTLAIQEAAAAGGVVEPS